MTQENQLQGIAADLGHAMWWVAWRCFMIVTFGWMWWLLMTGGVA